MSGGASGTTGGLREIGSPQAFGSSRKRFWTLVWLSSTAEFKLMYAGSALGVILGYAWALVRPLLTFAVIYIVFSEVFRVGASVPYYASMLLFNLAVFFFLGETSDRALQGFTGREDVLRKTRFPRAVIPFSIVLTGLFTFALNLIAVFALVLAIGTPVLWTWVLLPLLWLAMLVFVTAVSVILSTQFVRFRDVSQIWALVSLMLFYFSPIMYPVELVPERFDWLLAINPIAPIFEQMRVWAVDPAGPTALDVTGDAAGLIGPLIVFAAVCAYAAVLMPRRARTIAEDL